MGSIRFTFLTLLFGWSFLLSKEICFSQYDTTSLMSTLSYGSTLNMQSIIYRNSEEYLEALNGV